MKPSPPTWLIGTVVLFGILSVSTSSIFIRFAQADQVNSMVISTARLVVATIALLPLVWFRHRQEVSTLTRREIFLGATSGFFLALHFFSWITSLEYTTITSSVVLVTTTPLWVALLAPLLLKEKVTRALVAGMIVALIGGIIIAFSDVCSYDGNLICPIGEDFWANNSFFGNFLALFGAWMAAGYIMIGRQLRAKLSLIPYIFLVYGMAAVISVMIIFFLGLRVSGYAHLTYLWLILLGIVPQLFGHSSFNWSLKYVKASLVSVMLLGEPIGSTILGFIIFNETPSFLKVIGGVSILGGILLTTYPQGEKSD